jgi:diguanylate cyclase (GGDEF)-like protein/PAS domain S-box-containing protein
MSWVFTGYAIPLFIGSIILVLVSILAIRHDTVPAARYLAVSNIAMALYLFGYAIELGQTSTTGILFWSKIQYLGIAISPAIILMMILSYTGRDHWLTTVNKALLLVIPAMTIAFAWTNEYHEWIWADLGLNPSRTLMLADFVPGWWYWVNIGYLYTCMIISVGLLLGAYRHASILYRRQIMVILTGLLAPMVTHLFYIAGLASVFPIPSINWQAYAMIITALAASWGILNYQLFDITPVTYRAIFENLEDGVIVFDSQDRVVDFNPRLHKIFHWDHATAIGKTIKALLPPQYYLLLEPHLHSKEASAEIDAYDRSYDVRISPLKLSNGKNAGKLIVLRDVTARKKAEIKSQEMNLRLQEQLNKVEALQDQLREESIRGPLTGLFNRRYLDETLQREILRVDRNNTPLSLMMLDLDAFKSFNDTYGHRAGDFMLQALGYLLLAKTRGDDIACRYGGEEFIVVFPGARLKDTKRRADQIRQNFFDLRVSFQKEQLHSTLSIGVAA